jgi:hypothetical protein
VAGVPGAVAVPVGVFLPVYLFVVVPFPFFDRISGNARVKAFVADVTAAALADLSLRRRSSCSNQQSPGSLASQPCTATASVLAMTPTPASAGRSPPWH